MFCLGIVGETMDFKIAWGVLKIDIFENCVDLDQGAERWFLTDCCVAVSHFSLLIKKILWAPCLPLKNTWMVKKKKKAFWTLRFDTIIPVKKKKNTWFMMLL